MVDALSSIIHRLFVIIPPLLGVPILLPKHKQTKKKDSRVAGSHFNWRWTRRKPKYRTSRRPWWTVLISLTLLGTTTTAVWTHPFLNDVKQTLIKWGKKVVPLRSMIWRKPIRSSSLRDTTEILCIKKRKEKVELVVLALTYDRWLNLL